MSGGRVEPKAVTRLNDFVCTNRKYFNGKYLSPEKLCEGCQYEVGDLFAGTSGKSMYGYFCNYARIE